MCSKPNINSRRPSIRSYFGARLGDEGSFMSAGFLGRVLAAVAGFGSAGTMRPTVLAERVTRWASIPQRIASITPWSNVGIVHTMPSKGWTDGFI
jgi:hypothetical protein